MKQTIFEYCQKNHKNGIVRLYCDDFDSKCHMTVYRAINKLISDGVLVRLSHNKYQFNATNS